MNEKDFVKICKEEIVDYVTKFSGLVKEDLDEVHSTRYLVDRKNAYKQLRYLVDQGCIFVGHGCMCLKRCFRH